MSRLLKKLIPLVLLFMVCGASAEETILLGTVASAGTGEVIPNASVYFKGTQIGTTTDGDGFFYLRVDVLKPVKLVVSAVGYSKQTFDIKPGESAGIEVRLLEKSNLLGEVEALASDKQVNALMSRVRAGRILNRKTAEAKVPSNETRRTRYFISDIRPRQLKHKLWRSMQSGMIQQSDSSFMLPLAEDGYAASLVPMPEHFDFYQSTIPFHTVSFVSPLAAGSNAFYRFYLLGSLSVSYGYAAEKHDRVHFLPRNTFNPLLEGVLEIDSASARLCRVEATMPREVNVNYLNALHYDAVYAPVGSVVDERLAVLMETEIKADTTKLFPSLLGISEYVANGTSVTPDTLVRADSAVTAFLETTKPAPLPELPNDSLLQTSYDSLALSPVYRVARWAAELIMTGYIPTGTAVDIGRINDIIGGSHHEKLFIGLPFKTNERMSRYVSLSGGVMYGFRDRGVKYNAALQVMLPALRRHLITLSVRDRYSNTDVHDFEALRNENGWTKQNYNFSSYIFRNLYYNKVTAINNAARVREVSLSFEDDWRDSRGAVPGVESTVAIKLGRQGYGNPELYHYYDMPSFPYASLQTIVRLGWDERTVDFFTIRKHYRSNYPTLWIGAELGSYRIDEQTAFAGQHSDSYSIYGRLNLLLNGHVALGIGGTLGYSFEAGLVLGKVPYPLLSYMSGNQGVTYQPQRFTLMNNMQYAADKYLLLQLDWDGRGILFSQIPGVRYARLHELLEMKLAYGALSESHQSVIDYRNVALGFHNDTFLPLTIPYVEAGVGIGNILRIAELWSVWKLTHHSDPTTPWWALRFRLNFSL